MTSGSNDATLARKLAAETYLNWNQSFKDHNVGVMVGASVEDWYDEDFTLAGSNYVSESIISSNAQEVKMQRIRNQHLRIMQWRHSSGVLLMTIRVATCSILIYVMMDLLVL